MLVAATFLHTMWIKRRMMNVVRDADVEFRAGFLAFIDIQSGRLVGKRPLDSPSGFLFLDDELYVNSMFGNRIYVLDRSLDIVRSFSSSTMNDLHSIERTKRGLLVTSSGIDSIIEYDTVGLPIWCWSFSQRGYGRAAHGGIRTVNPLSGDHRHAHYATVEQTTHCNSATFAGHDEDVIAATLFVPGEVVLIDRRSEFVRRVVCGLAAPHSLRRVGDQGWLVCDSRAGSLVLLDTEFNINKVIDGPFDWVQDAMFVPGVGIVVADANHFRLVTIDPERGELTAECRYQEGWKIYEIGAVPDAWAASVTLPSHAGWRDGNYSEFDWRDW